MLLALAKDNTCLFFAKDKEKSNLKNLFLIKNK